MMKQKTINILLEMGMSANIKGFSYITDAMVLFNDDMKFYHGKTMDLYNKIAEKNNTTSSRVERAIRHAFTTVLKKGDSQIIDKYLPKQNTSNSNLLHVLYLRITQNE